MACAAVVSEDLGAFFDDGRDGLKLRRVKENSSTYWGVAEILITRSSGILAKIGRSFDWVGLPGHSQQIYAKQFAGYCRGPLDVLSASRMTFFTVLNISAMV